MTAEEPIPEIAFEEDILEEEIPEIPAEAISIEEPAPKTRSYDVREVYGEKGISRPLEELKEPEQSRSAFDSVESWSRNRPKKPTRVSGDIESAAGGSGPVSVFRVHQCRAQSVHGTKHRPRGYGWQVKLKAQTADGGRSSIIDMRSSGRSAAAEWVQLSASDNNLGGVLRAVKEMVQSHIEEEQQDKAINDFKRESMILSTLDRDPDHLRLFLRSDEGLFIS